MSSSKSNNPTQVNHSADSQFVDVLYQKLGENWFAFSLIDNEMFMSPVSDDRIVEIKCDGSAVTSIRANAEFDNEAA